MSAIDGVDDLYADFGPELELNGGGQQVGQCRLQEAAFA
jgi:hypothetical protein